ncbi:MAG: ZIP family metal transporter [Patescibacteria group bacterium]|jgi:ZIP family zinc transporter
MWVHENVAIILLALISGLTTIIGVWLAYIIHRFQKLIVAGIGFSTGIMVLISVFDLIPESAGQLGLLRTLLFAAGGATFSALMNLAIPHMHLIKEHVRQQNGKRLGNLSITAAYLIAFGLILHDVPEGFAMANSYIHTASLGILVAIAIALHNIPEEFAMALPMIAMGKSRKFLFRLAVISGLAEPVGAVLGLLAANWFTGINHFLLAFTAGIMLFIALHELWPMALKYKKYDCLIYGIMASLVVFIVLHAAIPSH